MFKKLNINYKKNVINMDYFFIYFIFYIFDSSILNYILIFSDVNISINKHFYFYLKQYPLPCFCFIVFLLSS